MIAAVAQAAKRDSIQSKSERTRERLVAAAATVLSRRGYAGTRLSDVAEEAGLQAPTIYYYFSSRELLIEEVMIVGTTHLREYVKEQLAQAPAGATALERLDIAVEAHLRQLMSESAFAHAVMRNLGQIPPEVAGRLTPERRKYATVWKTLFKAAAAEHVLREELDSELAQDLILGLLNWAVEWWNPKRGPLEQLVATAQAIIRTGVGTP